MMPTVFLLITLASTAICAPAVIPEMQLSARTSEDPYDDSITIVAEPKPYDLDVETAIQNSPLFRFGHLQGLTTTNEPYFWYPSTSTSNLGNKIFFQNLPSTFNVPNNVNSASNLLSTYFNRFKEFLQQAQQNAAQLTASWQNLKGDQYYNYGLPSHPGLWTMLHKPAIGKWKTAAPQVSDASVMPAYQVIAVMPVYDSPPLKIADYLRQSSMNMESMRNGRSMAIDDASVMMDQIPISKMEYELKKDIAEEIKKEMTDIASVEEKEVEDFAKDVAKEISSAVAEAVQKPGKLTEVVVRVDAINVGDDDDDDDSSSSSSSSEEDDDNTEQNTNKSEHAPAKKPTSSKLPVKDDKDDSSSSDSDESSQVPSLYPTLPQKTTKPLIGNQNKKKNPNESLDDLGVEKSSEDSSEDMDSVEKVAKLSMGARPLKVELEASKIVKLPQKDTIKKTV